MMPRVLVFDSGLGGLTVLDELRHTLPGAAFAYLADDAWFPYGGRAGEAVAARVCEVIGDELAASPADLVVIACNTASTVALGSLRAAHGVPFVGTVPGIKPAAATTRTGHVAVLATPATVARDYTRALIAEHGGGARFTLVGAAGLAALAESYVLGEPMADGAIAAEIAPAFAAPEVDTIVLACTHFPLLLNEFKQIAPRPVTWIDTAPAVARRAASLISADGPSHPGTARFTAGAPGPALAALLARHGLASAPAQLRAAS